MCPVDLGAPLPTLGVRDPPESNQAPAKPPTTQQHEEWSHWEWPEGGTKSWLGLGGRVWRATAPPGPNLRDRLGQQQDRLLPFSAVMNITNSVFLPKPTPPPCQWLCPLELEARGPLLLLTQVTRSAHTPATAQHLILPPGSALCPRDPPPASLSVETTPSSPPSPSRPHWDPPS